MIKREHIEKMKLLGAMLGDTAAGLSAVAINGGLEYAQRLTTDTALQAEVKATFKQDLATRDFKRAAQVVANYGKSKESVQPTPNTVQTLEPVKPAPEPAPSTPTFIPTEDKLPSLIPYLDVTSGFMTFGRVPDNMREIDYQPIRVLLERAGIIERFGKLTEKGEAWLQQAQKSA